jgi:hypothetical protein
MAFSSNPLHFSTGPVVATYNSIDLGYSEDGFSVRVEPFFDKVHSDDFGGRAGPPADEQLLAGIAIIEGDFTKYVKAEMDKLSSFQKGGTAGVFPNIGSFVRQDGLLAELVLDGVNDDWTFPRALIRRAFEVNKGTRYSRYRVGWEAWVNQTDYENLQQHTTRTLFTITTPTTTTTTT